MKAIQEKIGKQSAIKRWDDSLRLFNKGGKGRLYIPSMLAYGQNPPPNAPIDVTEPQGDSSRKTVPKSPAKSSVNP